MLWAGFGLAHCLLRAAHCRRLYHFGRLVLQSRQSSMRSPFRSRLLKPCLCEVHIFCFWLHCKHEPGVLPWLGCVYSPRQVCASQGCCLGWCPGAGCGLLSESLAAAVMQPHQADKRLPLSAPLRHGTGWAPGSLSQPKCPGPGDKSTPASYPPRQLCGDPTPVAPAPLLRVPGMIHFCFFSICSALSPPGCF